MEVQGLASMGGHGCTKHAAHQHAGIRHVTCHAYLPMQWLPGLVLLQANASLAPALIEQSVKAGPFPEMYGYSNSTAMFPIPWEVSGQCKT